MNKLNKLFMGFAAMSLFAACSSDDLALDGGPANGDNGTTGVGADGQMFMKVNIKAVNPSRANPNDYPADHPYDGGYKFGIASEHEVNDAKFFFFNEAGVFISNGSFWNGGKDGEYDKDPNIEYFGNNVLVFDKSTEKGNPRYMLTVLNAPDFEAEPTLELTAKSLALNYENVINDKRYFVMSTSSWLHGQGEVAEGATPSDLQKNHSDKYYYATRLDNSNFYTSADAAVAENKAVEVYVERLAAKYEVNVEMNADQISKTLTDGTVIYRVSNTIGGDFNTGLKPEDGDNTQDGATTAIYVKFLGWEVNTTAAKSFLSKQLGSDWTLAATASPVFKNWAKYSTVDFRTFWGKSAPWEYGVNSTDPSSNGYVKYQDKSVNLTKNLGPIPSTIKETDPEYAEYFSYSNENTNSAANIGILNGEGVYVANNQKVTNIVLRARACDVNGKPLDLVKYQGVIYKEASFLNHLLNNIDLGTKKNLNFWYATGDLNENGNPIYSQIDTTFLTIEGAKDGLGTVKAVAKTLTKDIYYISGQAPIQKQEKQEDGTFKPAVDEDGNPIYITDADGKVLKFDVYEKYEATDKLSAAEVAKAAIDDALAKVQGKSKAISYNGGEMVYFIPVKHINTVDDSNKPITFSNSTEGYYGVVRNHWYKIEVNSVAKLGHGVFDPGEGSNPGESLDPGDSDEDVQYYIGAKINILSWKVVNQKVEL